MTFPRGIYHPCRDTGRAVAGLFKPIRRADVEIAGLETVDDGVLLDNRVALAKAWAD